MAQNAASGFIALTNTMQLSGQETHEELWPGPGLNDLWRVFNCRADSWGPNNGVFTSPSDVFRPDMCVCFLLLAPPRQVEGFNCPPLRYSPSAPSLDVCSHSLLTPLGLCLPSLYTRFSSNYIFVPSRELLTEKHKYKLSNKEGGEIKNPTQGQRKAT